MTTALLLHFYPGLTPNNLGKITQRQRSELIKQVGNLRNFRLGSELEADEDVQRMIARQQLDQLIKQGRWN